MVDRPPFLITCDVGRTFELYADFSGQGRAYHPFIHKESGRRLIELDHLSEPHVQALFRQIWEDPRSLDPALERARVTRTIADHLAELSRSLERRGYQSQQVALFLSRLLFVLFAKDVGLLPRDKVTRLLWLIPNPEIGPRCAEKAAASPRGSQRPFCSQVDSKIRHCGEAIRPLEFQAAEWAGPQYEYGAL